MDAMDVLAIGVGVLVGAVAALKLIAPRTATKLDDRVLERLEQVLGYVPGSLKTVVAELRKDDAKDKKEP